MKNEECRMNNYTLSTKEKRRKTKKYSFYILHSYLFFIPLQSHFAIKINYKQKVLCI
jgi:hypothetical protein